MYTLEPSNGENYIPGKSLQTSFQTHNTVFAFVANQEHLKNRAAPDQTTFHMR